MIITPVLLDPMEKVQWLQDVCNKYTDFKIAYNYKRFDGSIGWSKHKTVMDCWENDLKFLFKATHRQILPYEIILDLDDIDSIKKVDRICDYLEHCGESFYCFSTGGKGYHIHIIEKKLLNFSQNYRRKIREVFFNKFDIEFDNVKVNDTLLISLEWQPHRKTGILKNLVRSSKWVN